MLIGAFRSNEGRRGNKFSRSGKLFLETFRDRGRIFAIARPGSASRAIFPSVARDRDARRIFISIQRVVTPPAALPSRLDR